MNHISSLLTTLEMRVDSFMFSQPYQAGQGHVSTELTLRTRIYRGDHCSPQESCSHAAFLADGWLHVMCLNPFFMIKDLPRVRSNTNCMPRAKGLSCSSTDLSKDTTCYSTQKQTWERIVVVRHLVPYLSVTMMAEGWAQAVMRVTMKRKTRKGMRVLQVRSHFPDTA